MPLECLGRICLPSLGAEGELCVSRPARKGTISHLNRMLLAPFLL